MKEKIEMKAIKNVVILIVEHDHGVDVWAHSTKDKAEESLEEYVRSWWDEEIEDNPIPTDRWEAITEYFEEMESECWRITELEIDRTTRF
jgi:hypothetical protein